MTQARKFAEPCAITFSTSCSLMANEWRLSTAARIAAHRLTGPNDPHYGLGRRVHADNDAAAVRPHVAEGVRRCPTTFEGQLEHAR